VYQWHTEDIQGYRVIESLWYWKRLNPPILGKVRRSTCLAGQAGTPDVLQYGFGGREGGH
jgi:hypothetical protein